MQKARTFLTLDVLALKGEGRAASLFTPSRKTYLHGTTSAPQYRKLGFMFIYEVKVFPEELHKPMTVR